jgi:hypothetical protein
MTGGGGGGGANWGGGGAVVWGLLRLQAETMAARTKNAVKNNNHFFMVKALLCARNWSVFQAGFANDAAG